MIDGEKLRTNHRHIAVEGRGSYVRPVGTSDFPLRSLTQTFIPES